MKKALKTAFVLCISLFVLTGCTEKTQEEEIVYDRRPMVMVDGRIYLDTGRQSYETARCGVMDGEITSEVDGSEVPIENDQSNFGTGYGYQRMDENTIELFINEKWVVFEAEEKIDEWGLTLKAENVTPTGCTLVFEQQGGNVKGTLQTGEEYALQVKKDGVWEKVDTLEGNYAWNDIAWLINKDGRTEHEVNWEWLYGALHVGEYRIAKSVMDFVETGNFEEKEYFAEFAIIN